MTYLFIESVTVNHSGIYTCRSNKNKVKSTHVQVLGQFIGYNTESSSLPLFSVKHSLLNVYLYWIFTNLSDKFLLSVLILSLSLPTCMFLPKT